MASEDKKSVTCL